LCYSSILWCMINVDNQNIHFENKQIINIRDIVYCSLYFIGKNAYQRIRIYDTTKYFHTTCHTP